MSLSFQEHSETKRKDTITAIFDKTKSGVIDAFQRAPIDLQNFLKERQQVK